MAFTGIMVNAYVPAKATFTSDEGRGIRVYIDGRMVNQYPRDFVVINRVRPGKHRVTVEYFGRRGRKLVKREVIAIG